LSSHVRPLLPALAALLLALAAGCGSSQAQSDADDVYRQGVAKSSGDTLGAMKIFEDGLTNYPNHTRMRFALARLQYDTGEVQHLEERRANAAARHAEQDGHASDVQKLEHEAQDHHAKALPYYRACRENLKLVVANDGDSARKAWAYELLMRCDIFFEDYNQAATDLEKAIDIGKPTGQKLVEYQGFMKELKDQQGTRKPAAN
jgi:tetratricopeptide (TPR) repeat protein